MGATKWRAQELILLEKVAASNDGEKQLKKSHTDRSEGRNYWFRNATNLFVMKYREAFSGCFEEESEVEFAYRQQRQRYAKLERYPKETEAERDVRLDTVNKRIESWLKSQSGSRSRRRKQGDGPSSTANATIGTPPHVPVAPVATAITSAPLVPFASTHAREGNIYPFVALDPVHAGELAMRSRDITPTDEQLRKFLNIVKEIQLALMQDRGWVGWCLFGGLDAKGELGNAHECTAYDRQGVSFEEYLAGQLGLTVNGLLCMFENFIGSSFGLPARALEIRARTMVPSASSGAVVAQGHPTPPLVLPVRAPRELPYSPHTPFKNTRDSSELRSLMSNDDHSAAISPWATGGSSDLLVSDEPLLPPPTTHSNGIIPTTPMLIKTPQRQDNERNPHSPSVVFGAPPPRVLTTAPEKPPAKQKKGRAPARREPTSRRSNTKGARKATGQTAAAEVLQTSEPEAMSQLGVNVEPEPEPEPLESTSLVLGRTKRLRVATARALDQSPDMSAANKLKRRMGVVSGGVDAGAVHAERGKGPVKRRNTGSK